MPLILGIETATEVCSVSLLQDGKMISYKESAGNNEHSRLLTPFIDEVLTVAGIKPDKLDAVAVSMGPGSYTGLRIGVSAAKGLCYALDKPLIAVGTLQAMAAQVMAKLKNEINDEMALLCPMIDARRMEVYHAVYNQDLNEIKPVEAAIIGTDFLAEETSNHQLILFGNGAAKCRDILSFRNNIVFLDNIGASANSVALLAEKKFFEHEFVDTAYFEPFYLKDFIAAKPRVKGLYSNNG